MMKRTLAELIGTFWLVFAGCGSAIYAATFPEVGIGLLGVALAFGLSVVTMAYAVGHISGCHLNPAVTFGLVLGGRFKASDALPYVAAQLVGAFAAALLLMMIANGQPGFDLVQSGFAANGYGEHSPGHYSLQAAFAAEAALTFIFLFVIHGATDARAPKGFAPLAIGLALTLIHLISIPITNTSVNPARSLSQAALVGGWAMSQVWLFCVAPLLGAGLGALAYRALASAPAETSAPQGRTQDTQPETASVR